MVAIPASAIVSVTPAVIGAGGTGLDLSGLMLTNSTRVPIGTVQPFSSTADVATYFGPSSPEAAAATVYFNGFENSTIKPAQMLFAQYPAAPVAAYLRGGSVASLTLAQLQAITGVITLTIDGVSATSGTITLTPATSFTNAATIIQTALAVAGVLVTYDAQSGGFVITSSTTGSASRITVATGSAAAALKLTTATGAVTSQGDVAGVPGVNMAAIAATTQNFASFSTLFEPVTADKIAFAAWTSGMNRRYVYVMLDSDVTVTTVNDTASAGYAILQAAYDGTFMLYRPASSSAYYQAFVMGFIASLDFTEVNGRSTIAFKAQAGLPAGVTNQTIAAQLIANGYNFYGAYATANDQFIFAYPGSITGQFDWLDSYVNQIWMNNGFQLALMALLVNVRSVPYNPAGYALIEAAMADVINQAVNFGAVRAGVPLSASQAAQVNAAAGLAIADVLSDRGWYVQVLNATAQVRAARGSPPVKFFYTDGQSVQSINLASVEIE